MVAWACASCSSVAAAATARAEGRLLRPAPGHQRTHKHARHIHTQGTHEGRANLPAPPPSLPPRVACPFWSWEGSQRTLSASAPKRSWPSAHVNCDNSNRYRSNGTSTPSPPRAARSRSVAVLLGPMSTVPPAASASSPLALAASPTKQQPAQQQPTAHPTPVRLAAVLRNGNAGAGAEVPAGASHSLDSSGEPGDASGNKQPPPPAGVAASGEGATEHNPSGPRPLAVRVPSIPETIQRATSAPPQLALQVRRHHCNSSRGTTKDRAKRVGEGVGVVLDHVAHVYVLLRRAIFLFCNCSMNRLIRLRPRQRRAGWAAVALVGPTAVAACPAGRTARVLQQLDPVSLSFLVRIASSAMVLW